MGRTWDPIHSERGFSLIEIAVVLGLISITIGMATAFSSDLIENSRVIETATNLNSFLKSAFMTAKYKKTCVRVSYDATNLKVLAEQFPGPNCATLSVVSKTDQLPIPASISVAGISLNPLMIATDGLVVANADRVIDVQSKVTSVQRELQIFGMTGKVSIK
jgi:prepilin-type N-terminal cleavage/methylation domain-containing protein